MIYIRLCLPRGAGSPTCASVSPALKRGSGFFCGSAPKIQQREGGKIVWQVEKRWGRDLGRQEGSQAGTVSPSPLACPPFPSPETHVFCKEILGLGFNLQGGCGGCLSRGTSTQTSFLGERDRLGYVFTGCFFKAGQPLHLTPCFLPSICPHSRNLGVSFCVCVRGRRVAPGVARALPAILLHWVGPAILDHYVHTTIIGSVCVRAVSPPKNNN